LYRSLDPSKKTASLKKSTKKVENAKIEKLQNELKNVKIEKDEILEKYNFLEEKVKKAEELKDLLVEYKNIESQTELETTEISKMTNQKAGFLEIF